MPNKNSQKSGNKRVLPHPIKGTYEKPTANIIFSDERLLFHYNQKQVKDACSHHFYTIMYWKSQQCNQERKIKKADILERENIKRFSFMVYMIVYIDIIKSTEKSTSKVAFANKVIYKNQGIAIYHQWPIRNCEVLERILFTLASKNRKCLRIKLTKDMQNSYRKKLNKWRDIRCLQIRKFNISKMSILTKFIFDQI